MKKFTFLTLMLLTNILLAQNYNFLGDYTSDGTPLYLEPNRDKVTSTTMTLINNSLPEGYPVSDYNPHYISSGYDTDIILYEQADVYVTFVKEGAGYKNVLGFYTYDISSKSVPKPQPEDITIIFPNVSAEGSGGSLKAGDKVKIGSFPAGTGIGWVLLANGWNGSKVTSGQWQVYSNPDYNPESDPSLRYHNVLLADPENKRVFLGFEDIRRDWSSCDNDFNDAIFYVTANPYTAIKTVNLTDVNSATNVTSANAGGLESNGKLAGLIANRNFTRNKLQNQIDKKDIQLKFRAIDKFGLKSAQIKALETYIPESGMYGTETAHISSPKDLIAITNAEKVFSVDYYLDDVRISAVLATETKGTIYDHSKVICDRLNSSSLEDIRTVLVRGHQIISAKIQRAGGEIENSLSFSVRLGETQNELFSFWNIAQYPEGDYYNFQIWGSSYSQVFSIANHIIDSFNEEKPMISESSEDKIPNVFVRSGYYANGEVHLNLINKYAVQEISVQSSISPTEKDSHVDATNKIKLSGSWHESVSYYTGSLFDIGLSIYSEGSTQHDALYLADGPWAVDYLSEDVKIQQFEIDNYETDFNSWLYCVERHPNISGEVKGTVNLFRQILPGDQSLDVTEYHSIQFNIESSHAIEVVVMPKNGGDWSNRFRKVIPASSTETFYAIAFEDFVDGAGNKATINDVQRVVFSVIGNYQNFAPFHLSVNQMAFNSDLTSNVKVSLDQSQELKIFPNPFDSYTTIELQEPTQQVNIKVYDLSGRIVDAQNMTIIFGNTTVEYRPRNLRSGFYKYVITDDNSNQFSGSFIKN
ncbi:DUF4114 domain-containing protein [uncultured Sunxiuqinia sp.]|uniref:DUF4114 domain-containing protein n=1 Tax=uncultured Sunxiuqinia sp. TaxID=1573825 RepID=UPI002AA93ED4|nr:DUF4114 domain-containing protein [uncultured Sunxiuqinia sp.]